jgi:hypothetical protein|tara:strand:+ start:42 stop:1349 length:1308 start_codon:yes stop_codon:yes gene_type:complete
MSDEPVNILSRRLSKFFRNTSAANFDYVRGLEREAQEISLYRSNQKSFTCISVSHYIHNSPALAGHFPDARVLSSEGIKKLKINIWFVGDDSYLNDPIPNPFTTSDPALKSIYFSMTKTAIITQMYSNISFSDILTVEDRNGVYYVTGTDAAANGGPISYENRNPLSPKLLASLYGDSTGKIKKINSFKDVPCIAESNITPGACYVPGPWPNIRKYRGRDKGDLTFDDLKMFAKHFDIVLGYISKHESGGDGYNANNIGIAGLSVDLKKTLGKNLTDMTINELRGNQRDNGGILFATGKYQIIPKTLGLAVATLPEIANLPYDVENQDGLGLFLASLKRKRLGKFLILGKGSLKGAGNDLALEWAFAPFLQQQVIDKKLVRVGHSPYEGKAGNKTNPKRVAEVTNILAAQRKKIEKLPFNMELNQIIEKFRKVYE